VGTTHALVHPFAATPRLFRGHEATDVHAPQSTPLHPRGHAPTSSSSSSSSSRGEASSSAATQCAQLAGCGLRDVHSDALFLHGGSCASYAFEHSARGPGEGG
jgi:hypothetical protein